MNALSPDVLDYYDGEVVRRIVEKHGLVHHHELNGELPEEERWEWLLIAARRETIEAYLERRRRGDSPARSLAPFYDLLSYDAGQGVHTGYDAYREYFPRER